jgi:hypothetical protein
MDILTLFTQWIDAQIQHYLNAIAQRRADYQKKNWRWNEDAVRDFNVRISALRILRPVLVAASSLARRHGDGLLTLANIVYNEAGPSNLNAKKAVAYAWLNRAGTVREPTGAEISEYRPLRERWEALADSERLSFLSNFVDCIREAGARLNDPTPANNDPTRGATHWVSPRGLPVFTNQKDRYARTVDTATNRAFPKWARSMTDPEVSRMQKRGQLGPNYAELTVLGVERSYFLFYTDVR